MTDLDRAAQQSLLSEAAEVRIQSKARDLIESVRLCGWESALWRGLFRGLGYKHNIWPMQHLAEQLPAMQALGPVNVEGWQARLLGVAGWLPEDLSSYSKAGRFYLRNLWDHWWRERAALDPYQLPPSSWHLGGLRPANHTIRRLVLLAHWLAAGNVASRLEMWLQTDCPKAWLVSSLTELLNVAVPEFWKHHWTLRSP